METILTQPSAMDGKKRRSRCSANSMSMRASVALGTCRRPMTKHATTEKPTLGYDIHVCRTASLRSRLLGPVMMPTNRRTDSEERRCASKKSAQIKCGVSGCSPAGFRCAVGVPVHKERAIFVDVTL